jgi:hypothetical protein
MTKIICLITVTLLFSGCIFLPNDAGIYNISRYSESFTNRRATENELNHISNAVKNTAEEFGFLKMDRQEWQDSNIVCYSKRPNISTNYDHLNGSKSSLTICIMNDPSNVFISIRNWKGTIETDFSKAFTARLEKELSKIIDMKKVRFKMFVTLT